MPFVNIKILKGHSQERKNEMSRRISDTIRDVAQLPAGADVWWCGRTSATKTGSSTARQ